MNTTDNEKSEKIDTEKDTKTEEKLLFEVRGMECTQFEADNYHVEDITGETVPHLP